MLGIVDHRSYDKLSIKTRRMQLKLERFFFFLQYTNVIFIFLHYIP